MADRYEELERLQRLRESGALTEEEFQAEKNRLLGQGTDSGATERTTVIDAEAPRSRTFVYVALGVAGLLLAVAAGLWLGRNAGPEQAPVAGPTNAAEPVNGALPVEPAAPPRTEAERLADAFEAATGHRTAFNENKDGDEATTMPLRIVQLPFGPVLFTKYEIKDGCHACLGALGIYYLREEGGKTEVTGRWPDAVPGWGWGAAPMDWSLTDKFTAFPAIFSAGGGGGQGIDVEGFTLTELRPAGPVTSDVVRTSFSNAGQAEDGNATCEIKGRVANIRRDQGFDVIVTGSANSVDHYAKRNGKFVPTSTIDWDFPCGTGE